MDTSAVNPFFESMTIETKKSKELVSRNILFDQNGQEVGTELEKVEFIDKADFVKVFATYLPQFFDLSQAGFKVWCYIALNLEIGKDCVYVHRVDATESNSMTLKGNSCTLSQQTYYRGVSNLLKLGFIAKHPKKGSGWYFINPNAFFSGDRVKFAKTYILAGLPAPKVKVKNAITGETETLSTKRQMRQIMN